MYATLKLEVRCVYSTLKLVLKQLNSNILSHFAHISFQNYNFTISQKHTVGSKENFMFLMKLDPLKNLSTSYGNKSFKNNVQIVYHIALPTFT